MLQPVIEPELSIEESMRFSWTREQERYLSEAQIVTRETRGQTPAFQRMDQSKSWRVIVPYLLYGWILTLIRTVIIMTVGGVMFGLNNFLLDKVLHCGRVIPYSKMSDMRRRLFTFMWRTLCPVMMFALGFYRIRRVYVEFDEMRELRAQLCDGSRYDLRDHKQLEAEKIHRNTQPFMIVSNHPTDIDAVTFGNEFGPFSAVSKSKILSVPILSAWIRKIEFMCYSGKEGESIINIMKRRAAAYDRSVALGYSDKHLRCVNFAEGSTENGRYLLHFHLGAFSIGRPVWPVLLRYKYRHFNPTSAGSQISGLTWWLLLTGQIYNELEIIHFPVYVPTDRERHDPALFAADVRKVMCAACNRRHPDVSDPAHLELATELFTRKKHEGEPAGEASALIRERQIPTAAAAEASEAPVAEPATVSSIA